MQETQEQTIDLRGIFKIIRKRLGLILFSALIVTILGSIYTFFIASPVYTASTQLVVKLPNSDNSAAYAGQVTGNIQMANTINQVIVSPVILDKVQSNLNLSDDSFQKQVTAANKQVAPVLQDKAKTPATPATTDLPQTGEAKHQASILGLLALGLASLFTLVGFDRKKETK